MANKESVGTVVVAGAANLGVAVAKVIAGTISGSSAMLSEAAQSFADTVTEGLLFTALRHGDQPPDARHPSATAAQIEARCEQAERRLRTRYPQIARVYLDPTPGGPASG